MAFDLGRGLRKISEMQSAIISQRVTQEAQRAIEMQEAEQNATAGI